MQFFPWCDSVSCSFCTAAPGCPRQQRTEPSAPTTDYLFTQDGILKRLRQLGMANARATVATDAPKEHRKGTSTSGAGRTDPHWRDLAHTLCARSCRVQNTMLQSASMVIPGKTGSRFVAVPDRDKPDKTRTVWLKTRQRPAWTSQPLSFNAACCVWG